MHSTLDHSITPRPARLLTIQTLGAFNDNLAKFGLLGLIATTLTPQLGESITTLTAALLIAPFILLAPIASRVCQRYSREHVIDACLIAQVLICVLLGLSGIFENLSALLISFGLLACQSAIFSPAKQAILKEWVGPERVGRWVAWMGLSSVFGILLGSAIGGFGYDQFHNFLNPYRAFTMLSVILLSTSFACYFAFHKFRNIQGNHCDNSSRSHKRKTLFAQFEHSDIRIGTACIATFYAFGGFLLVCLSQIARNEVPDTAASTSGLYAAFIGIGFISGSLLVGYLQRKHVAKHLTPFACLMVAIASTLLVQVEPQEHGLQNMILFLLGAAGAALVLPMQTLLQLKTEDAERGPLFSQVNAITNILSISLLGAHAIFNIGQISYRNQIVITSMILGLLSLYLFFRFGKDCVVAIARFIAKSIYHVKVHSSERLPAKGGALLVANHLSWADAVIVTLASPREIRFMGSADLLPNPFIRFVFKFFDVIPVNPSCARQAIKSAREAIENGDCVCIFPEGGISQTGFLHSLKKGTILIARQSNAPVIPIYLDRIWGSLFSFSDNRFFKKLPRSIPYKVEASFGEPIEAKIVTTDLLRDHFSKLSYLSMTNRVRNQNHIAKTAIKNLKQSNGPKIIDRTIERKEINNRQLLVLTDVFRSKIDKTTKRQRIGIALPMSGTAIATNLACSLCGKSAVFLNTTTSKEIWESYANTAAFDTVLTVSKIANMVREKAPKHIKVIEIDSWLQIHKIHAVIALIRTTLLPASHLAKHADDRETTILFTSGSSGQPKGVSLSPENILTNCLQVWDSAAIRTSDRILANLPPFHSFGYTMGCWMPLISGNTIITTPNPLDSKKSTEAIYQDSASILLATPTLLRAYLRKSKPEELASLRAVIAGAERLPETLQDAWETKFGSEILLGYGMTEASPVISLNVTNPLIREGKEDDWRCGKRARSSGRILPGIRARLKDPETGQYAYGTGRGILEIQGVNVSSGYIQNESANKERFVDGWLQTGDIVRIDTDGFLFIEGRLSRFAKIGGEMVPLDSIERGIEDSFSKQNRSTELAIIALPDEQKGEKLILFYNEPLQASELRAALINKGLPNLWVPKEIIHLDLFPKLASGKIDYAELNKMGQAFAEPLVQAV